MKNYLHTASEIDTFPASVESEDTYRQNIQHYMENNYTYIPIISELEYYHVIEEEMYSIDSEQFAVEDTHLMEVLRRMREYPFLITYRLQHDTKYVVRDREYRGTTNHLELIDKHATVPDEKEMIDPSEEETYLIWELDKEHPNLAETHIDRPYKERYGIITLADLNKRGLGEMIYPIIAELENQLAKKIRAEYPDDDTLVKYLRSDTVGRWYKDSLEGIDLHIVEHMNLVEMQEVIRSSSNSFVNSCGFSSKNQVQKQLGSINNLRNKVMHTNRSLVRSREEIDRLLERINRYQDIISRLSDSEQ